MGVPKFYRWISERYPCLAEIVKQHEIPEFDNLYLDMNGIIHVCSHPNDEDAHFRISEEQIFRDIFRYIEVLFRTIRPRKTFFMAVDGVAPRAKMNQQRGRRFMSARTAEELIEEAERKGETLPPEDRFDSNCITPGTSFMAKLHAQLVYFVNMKITTDTTWQGIKVYLSGHDVPGEGEHKIMDYIRYARSLPDYDPNTRHCLYGLDADLIMLGLCSHEPHFSLLREEIKFGRLSKNSKRMPNPDQTTFYLLHLSLMRDYIDLEFSPLKEKISFPYNLENIIDDWVLMGFLVGNDFIPHLPYLHIHQNSLPTMYKSYMTVMPELDGYLNESGFLNLPRFEKFIKVLSQIDRDAFGEEFDDQLFLRSKSAGNMRNLSLNARKKLAEMELDSADEEDRLPLTPFENDISPAVNSFKWKKLIVRSGTTMDDGNLNLNSEDSDEEGALKLYAENVGGNDNDWNPLMDKEFKRRRIRYYQEKMNFSEVTPEILRELALQYVKAIQWTLHYYYNGICSWSWHYPHHYAPYLSDIKDFTDLKFNFVLGEPFLPFQQLMAVLPAASRTLVPPVYQPLMCDSNSPIIDFYPTEFRTDLNGKKNEWEAVILIPFIKEKRLMDAMEPLNECLTTTEQFRNRRGCHLLFTTASSDQGLFRSSLPGTFPDLRHNRAACCEIDSTGFRLPISQIKKGFLPGASVNSYYVGFPSLKVLPHKGELKAVDVRVFQQESKNESMVITIDAAGRNQIDYEKAKQLIDSKIYINWPYLSPALVTSISTETEKFTKNANNGILRGPGTLADKVFWSGDTERITSKYMSTRAVEIGEIKALVYARPLVGRKYDCDKDGNVSLRYEWGENLIPCALQAIITPDQRNVVKDEISGEITDVKHMFPVDCRVFFTSVYYYGCSGIVKELFNAEKRIRILVELQKEPDFSVLLAQQERHQLYWYPAKLIGQKLGLTPMILSRITGSIFVTNKASLMKDSNAGLRFCIGLSLKSSKRNEEVADYTKSSNNVWFYSSNVLKILDEYTKRYPEVFNAIQVSQTNDVYAIEDIWRDGSHNEKLKELMAWLKTLPCYGRPRQAAGTETVDERMIALIEKEVQICRNATITDSVVDAQPSVLYRPDITCVSGLVWPDERADFQLFDRVVNVRVGFCVPVGLRGTVVGIHGHREDCTLELDVLFDEEFTGGVNIRNQRLNGYRVPAAALLNLTFGAHLMKEKKWEKAKTQNERPHTLPQQSKTVAAGGAQMSNKSNWRDQRLALSYGTVANSSANRGSENFGGPGNRPLTTSSASDRLNFWEKISRVDDQASLSRMLPQPPVVSSSMRNDNKESKTSEESAGAGKSIMKELFPSNSEGKAKRPGKKVSTAAFINNSFQKKSEIDESSRALRTLLHIGEKDGKNDVQSPGRERRHRKETFTKSRSTADQTSVKVPSLSTTPSKVQHEMCVPFTARQPQPPPFEPPFESKGRGGPSSEWASGAVWQQKRTQNRQPQQPTRPNQQQQTRPLQQLQQQQQQQQPQQPQQQQHQHQQQYPSTSMARSAPRLVKPTPVMPMQGPLVQQNFLMHQQQMLQHHFQQQQSQQSHQQSQPPAPYYFQRPPPSLMPVRVFSPGAQPMFVRQNLSSAPGAQMGPRGMVQTMAQVDGNFRHYYQQPQHQQPVDQQEKQRRQDQQRKRSGNWNKARDCESWTSNASADRFVPMQDGQ